MSTVDEEHGIILSAEKTLRSANALLNLSIWSVFVDHHVDWANADHEAAANLEFSLCIDFEYFISVQFATALSNIDPINNRINILGFINNSLVE